MFKNFLTNLQPAPVVGGKSVLTIGCGASAPTLDKLQMMLSAATGSLTVADIEYIKGKINGREFYLEGDGVTHNKRRDYLGLFTDPSELVLDFTEPNARTQVEQNLTALPLSLMKDLRFELKFKSSAVFTGGAIETVGHMRAPTQNAFVKKLFHIPQAFAAGGVQDIFLPNGDAGGKLMRVWLHEGTPGNVQSVELRARNAIGIEGTRTEIQNSQKHNKLVPQAGVLVLDFIEDGNLGGWFDTSALSDVKLKLKLAAADSMDIYLEYADPIARL